MTNIKNNNSTLPESRSEEDVRLDKLASIHKLGIDPYPSGNDRTHTITEITSSFSEFEKSSESVTLVGRLRTFRRHGGSTFANLEDGTGMVQLYFKKDEVGENAYTLLKDVIDAGDFIQATGIAFNTQKGEKSVLVKEYKLLTKTLLPLPEKWHGLKDEEVRYRKRYLDILTNPEVKELFIKKSRFWGAVREFLTKNNFLEVETPVLETTTGGADARPFITHHNALDIDVYLRISMGELWQKRLMVAGYERTFEIGRVFRNEGMDADHLQDYTQMEFYWAYADWNDGMNLVEELVKYVAEKAFGTLRFNIKGEEIDLGHTWQRYDYREEVLNRTGVDIDNTSVKELKDKLKELNVSYDDFDNLPRGIDQLWKYCRKQIIAPGYLIYPPKTVSPLAKESKERPGYVEQYQLILGGSEQCKGYSELNDPIDQEERFIEQQVLRDAGDDEAQMHDYDFVEALKHGMPPTTGLGFSERLFGVLADKPLREAQIFPLMKPRKVRESHREVQSEKSSTTMDAEENLNREVFPRDKAIELLHKHIKNENLRKHMYASEAVMRALARKFGGHEDAWGIAGLLHDIDWEETENNPEEHSLKAKAYLEEAKVDADIVNAIYVHNHMHGIEPETLLEKALYTAEELTGLITACALVQPDKKLENVKVSSVLKKFKIPSFASGVNRDIILQCEELLCMSLEELVTLELEAMQEIAKELGL